MTFYEKDNALVAEVVASLCSIKDRPKDWLPHTVFVEEVSEQGAPVYNEYKLHEINADGTCSLKNPRTDEFEDRDLNEIELRWLITVWGWYEETKSIENKD